jgi:arsenate reductase
MASGSRHPLSVLFLCTANSARSILAEGCLNSVGRDRFHACTAGSHPRGQVSLFALEARCIR